MAAPDAGGRERRPCKLHAGLQLATLAENGVGLGAKFEAEFANGELGFATAATKHLLRYRIFIAFVAVPVFIARNPATNKCRTWLIAQLAKSSKLF
jgi:hypothetical protein